MVYLQIENENIATIKDDTFSNLVLVEFLLLGNLKITTFEPFTFRGIENLVGLFVLDNALTTVPVELLRYVPKITTVYFNSNGILEIPKGFLNNNPHVDSFVFNENIKRFCKSLFNETTELLRVDLTNNPCVGSKSSFSRDDHESYQMFIDDVLENTGNCIDTCAIKIEDCTFEIP